MGAVRDELIGAGFCYTRLQYVGTSLVTTGATAGEVLFPWAAGWRQYEGFKLTTPSGGIVGGDIAAATVMLRRTDHTVGEKYLMPYSATYTQVSTPKTTDTDFASRIYYPGILLGGYASFIGAQDLSGYEVMFYPDEATCEQVVINYFPVNGTLATLWSGQMGSHPASYFWANPSFYGMKCQVIFHQAGMVEINFDNYQGGGNEPYLIGSSESGTWPPTVTATYLPPEPSPSTQAVYAIANGSTDSFLMCGGFSVNIPDVAKLGGLPVETDAMQLTPGGGSYFTAPGSFAAIQFNGPGDLPVTHGLDWFYMDNTDTRFYSPLSDGMPNAIINQSNCGVPGRFQFRTGSPGLRLSQRDDNLGIDGNARILGTTGFSTTYQNRGPRLGQVSP